MPKISLKKTRNLVSLILSGKEPRAKKYAGRHVLVVKDKILPLREGEAALKDLAKYEKKYGETPTLVFVPRPDISYILFLWRP